MSRSAVVAAILIAFAAGSAARAEGEDTTLFDARALVYFAKRHDRLWDLVEERLERARRTADPETSAALDEIEYDFQLDRARAIRREGGRDAEARMLEVLTRALGLGLTADRTAEARDDVVALRFARGKRLAEREDGLQDALDEMKAVLLLEDLSDETIAEAKDLQFRLARRDADRLLDAGDWTAGYEQLARVVKVYGEPGSRSLEEARRRLAEIDRMTGLLTVALRDVSGSLRGVKEEVAGAVLPLPRTRDVVSGGPDAVARLEVGAEAATLRLRTDRGTSFALVARFPGGERPDLRVPFSFERGQTLVELPDAIPARMAYVPGPKGPFLIGLYEVSAGEVAAFRRDAGRPGGGGQRDLPATGMRQDEVAAFLDYAGVVLPTREEWTLAALGTDGRDLPWGEGAVAGRANIWVVEGPGAGPTGPEPVTSRTDGASPYGLHHVLGNVWELVEWTPRKGERIVGAFALGGSYSTPYPLTLVGRRADGLDREWRVDLLRDARPLEPAKGDLANEQRRRWREVLYNTDNPEAGRVDQENIGFRVAVRIGK